ncbi:hypothetical protein BH09BAC4_BH09BAC4_27260 [soil metagenome]
MVFWLNILLVIWLNSIIECRPAWLFVGLRSGYNRKANIKRRREETVNVLKALFPCKQWPTASQSVMIVKSLSDLDPAGAMNYFDAIAVGLYVPCSLNCARTKLA